MKTVSFFKVLNSPQVKSWLNQNIFSHFKDGLDFLLDLGEIVIGMIVLLLLISVVTILFKIFKNSKYIEMIKNKLMWSSIFRS